MDGRMDLNTWDIFVGNQWNLTDSDVGGKILIDFIPTNPNNQIIIIDIQEKCL